MDLSQISWQVPESVYRQDPALSYSTLAKFEREGFDKLSSLFEHVSTPSLTLGSMVDTLITGSREEFDNLFLVADFPSVGDKEIQVAKWLFSMYKTSFHNLSEVPDEAVLAAANNIGYYPNWRDVTRVKVLRERTGVYYELLCSAGKRTVVSTSVYNSAIAMVRSLHESPATSGYFADDDPLSSVRRYYQLKFKATLNNIDFRCMADLLIVDYDAKEIIPVDLKTSGHPEWHFEDSFITWSYMIQSRLYWRIIRKNLDNSDYFKDFTLKNYRFVVVNKNTLTPLVWEFPLTQKYGNLTDETGKVYRDPFYIASELVNYLHERPSVPINIDPNGINLITCLSSEDDKKDIKSIKHVEIGKQPIAVITAK